jgi:hypothetical protein
VNIPSNAHATSLMLITISVPSTFFLVEAASWRCILALHRLSGGQLASKLHVDGTWIYAQYAVLSARTSSRASFCCQTVGYWCPPSLVHVNEVTLQCILKHASGRPSLSWKGM